MQFHLYPGSEVTIQKKNKSLQYLDPMNEQCDTPSSYNINVLSIFVSLCIWIL